MIDNDGVSRVLAEGLKDLPTGASKRVKLAAKAKTYETIDGAALLPFAVTMLDVYQAGVDFLEFAEMLGAPGPVRDPEVLIALRAGHAAACLAAHHRGETANRSSAYSAEEGLLEGNGLRGYIDRSPEDRVLDDLIPPVAHAGATVADMYTLAVMWRYGGSEAFPIQRILRDWDRNKQYLRTLRGF